MLTGLQKHRPKKHMSRRSSPQFMVLDTAHMSAAWRDQASCLLTNPEHRGKLVESAIGAYLINRTAAERFELRWWRDGETRPL